MANVENPADAARRRPAEHLVEDARPSLVVVEDDAALRLLFSEWLELRGYCVEAAADGPAGLDLILRTRPLVAFVDLGLPGFGGLEIGRRARAHPGLDGTYLVALSGSASEEDEAAIRESFDDHLVKPARLDRLSDIIEDRAAVSRRAPPGPTCGDRLRPAARRRHPGSFGR